MPATVQHVLSATTPDDPNYEIQPQHWNSAHAFTFNAAGSEISGAFDNGGGVTFGLETNGKVTAAAPVGGGGISAINVSAGTTSNNLSRLTFADSNGVSFGLNGSVVTATVATNYLTTAALSNHSHGASGQNGSFAFQTLSFSNANGVSFGTSAGNAITASHNGLTTARASNDAVGLNTALTAGPLAWTVNSSGISLNAGSAAGTTSGFTGNLISGSMTHNTAGLALSLNHPAWLTTARASNDAVGLNTAQSNVTWTVNSSGISLDGRGYAGTGTSATNASITLNSNGLAISVAAPGGGVTPVASASNGSFSFTTLAFSNANNVTFGTSAGSIVTASVAAPGAAAENNNINLLGANTAGNTTASGSTIGWSGVNVTLSGTNASQVVISAPATSSIVVGAGLSLSTNGSTISVLEQSVSMWEPNGFGNNSAFSSHGQNSVYFQRLWPENNLIFSNIEKLASVSFVSSSNSQSVAHTIRYGLYVRDTGTNSSRMTLTGSSAVVFQASYNSNTTAGFTISQSGGTSYTSNSAGTGFYSQLTAGKLFYLPFTSTLTRGAEYAFGFHVSTASAVNTGALRLSFLELTNLNNTTLGRLAVTTMQNNSATIYEKRAGLIYSTTSGALPSSYSDGQCSVAVSRARQYLIFEV